MRFIKLTSVVMVSTALVVSLGSVPLHARCNCTAPASVDAVTSEPSLVMIGTVAGEKQSNVTLSFDVGQISYLEKRVRFVPESVIRGVAADTVEILFYEGRDSCESRTTDFVFGQRYALSAVIDAKGNYCSNDCCLLAKNPPAAAAAAIQTDTISTPSDVQADETIDEPDAKPARKRWFRWFRKK